MSKTSLLGNNEMEFAIRCMSEWVRIKQDIAEWEDHAENPNGPRIYRGASIGSPDPDHSSLLRRLMSGEKALIKPPPKRYSYPDYELGEGKLVVVSEVWERDIGHLKGKVVVDQSPQWSWLNKEEGLLQHENGDVFFYQVVEPTEDDIKACLEMSEKMAQIHGGTAADHPVKPSPKKTLQLRLTELEFRPQYQRTDDEVVKAIEAVGGKITEVLEKEWGFVALVPPDKVADIDKVAYAAWTPKYVRRYPKAEKKPDEKQDVCTGTGGDHEWQDASKNTIVACTACGKIKQ